MLQIKVIEQKISYKKVRCRTHLSLPGVVLGAPKIDRGITIIILDQNINSIFFNNIENGNTIICQYLFRFFRHPEVYILILPNI